MADGPPARLKFNAVSPSRRPLLTRGDTEASFRSAHPVRDALYSCNTNSHSHLPVYTNIHRIRRDIISVAEDYLSLEQLTDVRINIAVVRPLVDKFYELEDVSIVYCLLVNRAQFLEDQSHLSNRHNVNWTRATLCELIAARILRRFGDDNQGSDGLLLLAHILVAGFEPFQNAPPDIRLEARERTSWSSTRSLPALEVAILTESKHFLGSATCQRVVDAIYEGRVIYTPSSFLDIIPDHYKRKPIALYDPRDSSLLNQYRLIVPRTRNWLETFQFLILLVLYIVVMVLKDKEEHRYSGVELAFDIYAFGWGLDQFATILEHGWKVYTQNLWSFLDVGFIGIYFAHVVLRIHGWRTGTLEPAEQAFDVLALAAPLLVPRLAFVLMSENLVFLGLRSMLADFFLLTALSAWCFFGFLLSLLWLGEGAHPIATISEWMVYIWFGLDGVGIRRSVEFHWLLGPSLMVAFAFLGNTLFLTILVSMLSNTFSNISSNATSEIQYRKAVLTLEGVKADAIFAYRPPFNILAVFILLPLKFVVSPRWFHKIHVASVRFLNLPLLLVIALAERRWLGPIEEEKQPPVRNARKRRFWHRWHLSTLTDIRAVFQVTPPDDLEERIAVDDDLTHHLIRRQFTRQQTMERPKNHSRKPSRRDSMFVPSEPKDKGEPSSSQTAEAMIAKMDNMEKALRRIELMLSGLTPNDEAIDDDSDLEDSGTLKDGFVTESSYLGQAE